MAVNARDIAVIPGLTRVPALFCERAVNWGRVKPGMTELK